MAGLRAQSSRQGASTALPAQQPGCRIEQRDVLRARIILLAAEGHKAVGTMPRTVSAWRGRFSREGLSGLADRPNPGPVPKYDADTGRRILAVLERAFQIDVGFLRAPALRHRQHEPLRQSHAARKAAIAKKLLTWTRCCTSTCLQHS
jgi:hypothetical protein